MLLFTRLTPYEVQQRGQSNHGEQGGEQNPQWPAESIQP